MEMFIGMETGQVATGAQLTFHVVIQSLRHVKSLQPHGLQHARGISLITFRPFTNFFDVKEIDFPSEFSNIFLSYSDLSLSKCFCLSIS